MSPQIIELAKKADKAYSEYINGRSNVTRYLDMRDTVVKEMSGGLSKDEFDAWKTILNSRSAADIWKKINWKGEVKGEVKGGSERGK